MKKIYIALILGIVFWPVKAQIRSDVKISTDTTAIRPGEQISLQVTAKTDTLSFADFPELTQLGQMEVVKSTPVDTLQAKPYRQLQKKYFITAWDSGQYVVPPINVKINNSVYATDSLKIQVQPVQVDTTKQGLYGFKAPVNIKGQAIDEISSPHTYLWWILTVLLLALSAYFFYLRRKRKIAAKKTLTPYEKAIKRLKDLQNEKLWLQNRVDEHYFNLTDTLKNYLEEELGLSAKEKISAELLQSLKTYRFENGAYFSPQLLTRLEETLKRADLAKFAKLSPNPADIDLDTATIQNVIADAHQVIEAIAAEKAAKLAEIERAKKRKKRVAMGIVTGVLLVLGLLGGLSYYYLHKLKMTKNLAENMSAAEWVYNEYGSDPALGLTTPHILHSLDISAQLDQLPDNLKKILEEISFYADENLIKKYAIVAGSMDFKQALPGQIDLSKPIMQAFLKQINARNVNMQQADLDNGKRYFGDFEIDLPVIGKNVKVEFDSRFYPTKQGLKLLMGFYLRGNKENQALIERVMQSAELVK